MISIRLAAAYHTKRARMFAAKWMMSFGMVIMPESKVKQAFRGAMDMVSDMLAFEVSYTRWLRDNECDHSHCPFDPRHMVVGFDGDDDLLCGECSQQGRRVRVQPCVNDHRRKLH